MTSPQIEPPAEIVEKWQETADPLVETWHLPSARVMNVEPPSTGGLVSSESEGRIYEKNAPVVLHRELDRQTMRNTRYTDSERAADQGDLWV